MIFWERQNYGDSKKNNQWLLAGVGGVGGKGGVNRLSKEEFEGREATLYETLQMETCHYTFVQTHRTHNIKSEP